MTKHRIAAIIRKAADDHLYDGTNANLRLQAQFRFGEQFAIGAAVVALRLSMHDFNATVAALREYATPEDIMVEFDTDAQQQAARFMFMHFVACALESEAVE